jgi:hypothetical protein
MSASNFLSPGHDEALSAVMDRPEVWDAVLRAEVEACRQLGAVDGGTHLIAVGRKKR